jgi:hypothetical protein
MTVMPASGLRRDLCVPGISVNNKKKVLPVHTDGPVRSFERVRGQFSSDSILLKLRGTEEMRRGAGR